MNKKKTYKCLVLSWEDIVLECEDDTLLMAKANQMNDADMKYLSEKIRDVCCEDGIFWACIREYVNGIKLKKKGCFNQWIIW